MIGYIIYGKKYMKKNVEFIRRLINSAASMDIDITYINAEDIIFSIKNNILTCNYPIVNFVINRSRDYIIGENFEIMGIPVFNNSNLTRIFNNKALTHSYISKLGINTLSTLFIDKNNVNLVHNLVFPKILKENSSFGGSQVFFINSYEELISKITDGKTYIIQDYNPNGTIDIRTFIVGKEIIASVKRFSNNNFKSNHSLGGNSQLYKLSSNEKNIINMIVNEFSLDYVGIDFMLSPSGDFIFNEIEDCVGARTLYINSDIDIAKTYIKYIHKKVISYKTF